MDSMFDPAFLFFSSFLPFILQLIFFKDFFSYQTIWTLVLVEQSLYFITAGIFLNNVLLTLFTLCHTVFPSCASGHIKIANYWQIKIELGPLILNSTFFVQLYFFVKYWFTFFLYFAKYLAREWHLWQILNHICTLKGFLMQFKKIWRLCWSLFKIYLCERVKIIISAVILPLFNLQVILKECISTVQ